MLGKDIPVGTIISTKPGHGKIIKWRATSSPRKWDLWSETREYWHHGWASAEPNHDYAEDLFDFEFPPIFSLDELRPLLSETAGGTVEKLRALLDSRDPVVLARENEEVTVTFTLPRAQAVKLHDSLRDADQRVIDALLKAIDS